MSENARQEVVTQKPRMAICYDFDKTLSPDDMQSFTLIPSLGMRPEDFGQSPINLQKTTLWTTISLGCISLLSSLKLLENPSVVATSTR